MKQLTGLDASWLYAETKTCPMHVGVVNIFAYPDDPTFSALEATRRQFASRLATIDPLRRKLVSDPLRLDHPYWVVDSEFDLDYHIQHLALPTPDDEDALTRMVARFMERPMDQSRPLWEAYVIEGLGENRWALFAKYHHAAIDGGAGILLAGELFDSDPGVRAEMPDVLFDDAESAPSTMDLMARASKAVLKQPIGAVKYQYDTLKHVVNKTREEGLERLRELSGDTLKSVVSGPSMDSQLFLPTRFAPPTPWNKAVSDRRDFLCHSFALADVLALKTRMGCSVNDVVMSICAGGLRKYLKAHAALPDEPLVAAIPVSERTGSETETWVNRISVVLSQLPTNVARTKDRVAAVQVSTGKMRELLSISPSYALGNLAELSSPILASTLTQVATKYKLSERTGSVMNLTVSNVAGFRKPLYMSGALLERTIPASLLNEGVGLNITVMSYTDRLDLGLTGCRKAIPDLDLLRECLVGEFAVLCKAFPEDK